MVPSSSITRQIEALPLGAFAHRPLEVRDGVLRVAVRTVFCSPHETLSFRLTLLPLSGDSGGIEGRNKLRPYLSKPAAKRSCMRGVITTTDVLCNVGLIWREFGSRCLWRCLRAALLSSRKTTFLEVALR